MKSVLSVNALALAVVSLACCGSVCAVRTYGWLVLGLSDYHICTINFTLGCSEISVKSEEIQFEEERKDIMVS